MSKRIGALLVIAIGIALFIFARYEQGRVEDAKSMISKGTSLFSGNPAGATVGDVLQGKASAHDTTLVILQFSGVGLVIVGIGMFICCHKRK